MIVETHSENFLFGVQIAVAKGDLAPEDVLIHWVRQDEAGRATVTLDLSGRLVPILGRGPFIRMSSHCSKRLAD